MFAEKVNPVRRPKDVLAQQLGQNVVDGSGDPMWEHTKIQVGCIDQEAEQASDGNSTEGQGVLLVRNIRVHLQRHVEVLLLHLGAALGLEVIVVDHGLVLFVLFVDMELGGVLDGWVGLGEGMDSGVRRRVGHDLLFRRHGRWCWRRCSRRDGRGGTLRSWKLCQSRSKRGTRDWWTGLRHGRQDTGRRDVTEEETAEGGGGYI